MLLSCRVGPVQWSTIASYQTPLSQFFTSSVPGPSGLVGVHTASAVGVSGYLPDLWSNYAGKWWAGGCGTVSVSSSLVGTTCRCQLGDRRQRGECMCVMCVMYLFACVLYVCLCVCVSVCMCVSVCI